MCFMGQLQGFIYHIIYHIASYCLVVWLVITVRIIEVHTNPKRVAALRLAAATARSCRSHSFTYLKAGKVPIPAERSLTHGWTHG